jgi:hypothetical protein
VGVSPPLRVRVLDRFHVKGHLTEAVNDVRKMDVAKLKKEGREVPIFNYRFTRRYTPQNRYGFVKGLRKIMGYFSKSKFV